jgi:uncharacterized protein YndB with AHSA1/START domain
MAPIVESIEIARPAGEVFSYVVDPVHLPDWQESVVNVRRLDEGPVHEGSSVLVTRQVGPRKMTSAMQFGELNAPTSWTIHGTDGPVRGIVRGTIEPLPDGERSRLTIALDFEGHGIGKLLVPLFIRRMAGREMPQNERRLKTLLEAGT